MLQLQAEKEIITQTMDAMKEELEREKELGQREQSVLLGHVEVLAGVGRSLECQTARVR